MKNKFGLFTAISVVVANMIGTGVFTTLGFQAADLNSPVPILLLWVTGGILAIAGALCYGELGAAFPRSGGEYNYLSSIYHPSLGFVSGWVSAVAGFPAPIALSAIAFGKYMSSIIEGVNDRYVAIFIVVLISLIHAWNRSTGKNFQNLFTVIKISLIGLLIYSGLMLTNSPIDIWTGVNSNTISEKVFSSGFAVSLIYVSYAYSGWNASAYLAGELENPGKNVLYSILIGTLSVMLLYLLLNYAFLYNLTIPEVSGKIQVGHIFSEKIFGSVGGKMMSLIICLLLLSSISSLVLIGPRILKTMGEDYPLLQRLSVENKSGSPYISIFVQLGIVILYIVTSSFEAVLSFIGFILNFITVLTVAGIFVIRKRNLQYHFDYKTKGYPIVPILYIFLNIWMMYFLLKNKTLESLLGLGLLAVGFLVYFILKKADRY